MTLCVLTEREIPTPIGGEPCTRAQRKESLPPRWLLPKTKVGLTYLPLRRESKRNSRIYNICASESLSVIWPVLVSLNLLCDSLKLKGTLWEPPAAEVNNEIWFPTNLNLNELPGSLLCCKDSCCGPKPEATSPGCVHHTPDWVPLIEAPDWELLSPSHSCKPLQCKTVI